MNLDQSVVQKLEKLRGARVAVVGGGYMGRRLYEFLRRGGLAPSVQLFTRSTVDDIAKGTWDYLFNCAGNTGDFREKTWETVESNIRLTSFLINKTDIREAYINLSSTRIYGFSEDEKVCFQEGDLNSKCVSHLDIDFVYDGTKKLVESILWNMRGKVKFRIVTCRLSNVYGRYLSKDLNDSTYLKVMLRHAIEKKTLHVSQNMASTKGYVYIDDALLGVVQSAALSTQASIYNICSGMSYSISDWLRYLGVEFSAVSGSNAQYGRNSIEKAKAELGFQPKAFLHNLEFNKIFEDGSN